MYVFFPRKYDLESNSYDYVRMYVCDDHFLRIQDDDVYRRVLSYISQGSGVVVSDRAGAYHDRDGYQYP